MSEFNGVFWVGRLLRNNCAITELHLLAGLAEYVAT